MADPATLITLAVIAGGSQVAAAALNKPKKVKFPANPLQDEIEEDDPLEVAKGEADQKKRRVSRSELRIEPGLNTGSSTGASASPGLKIGP